jgi:hypothetical protein
MRPTTRFTKGLIATVLATAGAMGLGGCGPDYAIFAVTVFGDQTDRDNISECYMSITDEGGHPVVSNLKLDTISGGIDPSTGEMRRNIQGCASGQMANNSKTGVGVFSYSTSRTSGALTFKVEAVDVNNKVRETCDPNCPSANVKAFPPEIQVLVTMKFVGQP